MPLYEHTFLSRNNLTPQQALGLADRFAAVITEGGGRLVDQEYWGLRSLAYRIRNNRKAHFCFLRTDAPAAAVREMERRMRINEDVLRVLTVRVSKHDVGATPIMKAKSSRDNRRPRRKSSDEPTETVQALNRNDALPDAIADDAADRPATEAIDPSPDAAKHESFSPSEPLASMPDSAEAGANVAPEGETAVPNDPMANLSASAEAGTQDASAEGAEFTSPATPERENPIDATTDETAEVDASAPDSPDAKEEQNR